MQDERIKALEQSRPTDLNSAFAEEENADGDAAPDLVEEATRPETAPKDPVAQELPVRRVSWAQKVGVQEYTVALLHNPGCENGMPIAHDKPAGEAFETNLLHLERLREKENSFWTIKEKVDLLRASGVPGTDIFDQDNAIKQLLEREKAQHDEWLDDGDDVVPFGPQSPAAILAAKKYRRQKIEEWQQRQTQE